jgi:hypothetical protein
VETLSSFVRFARDAQLRFYQERNLGLDLCHSGLGGIVVGVLAVATLTVFVLAAFHVIPERRHILRILLPLGFSAFLLGAGVSFAHYRDLPAQRGVYIRDTAGPAPANDAQAAAVIVLPLALGGATFVGSSVGCLYLSIFWGARLLSKKRGGER